MHVLCWRTDRCLLAGWGTHNKQTNIQTNKQGAGEVDVLAGSGWGAHRHSTSDLARTPSLLRWSYLVQADGRGVGGMTGSTGRKGGPGRSAKSCPRGGMGGTATAAQKGSGMGDGRAGQDGVGGCGGSGAGQGTTGWARGRGEYCTTLIADRTRAFAPPVTTGGSENSKERKKKPPQRVERTDEQTNEHRMTKAQSIGTQKE